MQWDDFKIECARFKCQHSARAFRPCDGRTHDPLFAVVHGIRAEAVEYQAPRFGPCESLGMAMPGKTEHTAMRAHEREMLVKVIRAKRAHERS